MFKVSKIFKKSTWETCKKKYLNLFLKPSKLKGTQIWNFKILLLETH